MLIQWKGRSRYRWDRSYCTLELANNPHIQCWRNNNNNNLKKGTFGKGTTPYKLTVSYKPHHQPLEVFKDPMQNPFLSISTEIIMIEKFRSSSGSSIYKRRNYDIIKLLPTYTKPPSIIFSFWGRSFIPSLYLSSTACQQELSPLCRLCSFIIILGLLSDCSFPLLIG